MSLASTTINLNGRFTFRVRQYGKSKYVHHIEVLDESEWEVVDIVLFQGDFERFKEAILREPEQVGSPVLDKAQPEPPLKEEL